MEEIWKDIIGYEDSYAVSNLGRVRSKERITRHNHKIKEKILVPGIISSGYLKIDLAKDNVNENGNIHRLVAEAFLPNPENKREVNHINGIKSDNRLENLEWATTSENRYHSYNVLKNKAVHGANHFQSKLTDNDARVIRYIYASKLGVTKSELSRLWNVHFETIKSLLLRETWKHVA